MSLIVYTVVLNWNNYNETNKTIECLLDQDYPLHKIILVDNNSEIKIKEKLKLNYPNIKHIYNRANLGYTGGNNIGIKYSLSKKADIIIIANNDIEIEDKGLITKAVSIFDAYEEIAILGPSLHYYSNKNKVQEAGTIFFYADRDKVRLNDFMLKHRTISDNIKYFDGVPGGFMMARSQVFKYIGFLDEKIFMYGDETDFCYRAWKNNLFCAIDESLIVYHKSPEDKVIKSPLKAYYITRNSLYFLKKHRSTIRNYKYFLRRYYCDYFRIILRESLSFWNNRELLCAYIKGMFDGIFGKMGSRF